MSVAPTSLLYFLSSVIIKNGHRFGQMSSGRQELLIFVMSPFIELFAYVFIPCKILEEVDLNIYGNMLY